LLALASLSRSSKWFASGGSIPSGPVVEEGAAAATEKEQRHARDPLPVHLRSLA